MKEYLIVDGYNVINVWDELKTASVHSLEVSRQKLLDIISDYQGFRDIIVIKGSHLRPGGTDNGARAGSSEAPGARAGIGSCCNEESYE